MIIQVSIKSLTHLLKAHEDLMKENRDLAERLGQKTDTKKYEDLLRKWEEANDRIRYKDREITKLTKAYNTARLSENDRWKEVQRLEKEKDEKSKDCDNFIGEIRKHWDERHRLAEENKRLKKEICEKEEVVTDNVKQVVGELISSLTKGVCEKEEEIDRLKNQLKVKEGWLPPVHFGRPPRKNQCLERPPRKQNRGTEDDWNKEKGQYEHPDGVSP